MKNFKYIYIVVALAFLAACGYEPEVERAGESNAASLSAFQVLEARGYTSLNAAIEYAGLTDAIEGASDSLTIFAPTNAAFNDLFARLGVSGLEDLAPETVAELLSYHVAAGGYFSAGLPNSMPTLLDGKSIYARGAVLNGKSSVSQADLVSTSGVIHGINRVLDIPADNVMAAIDADPELSTLATYIDAAGLRSTLANTNGITILAPTNTAFESLIDLTTIPQEDLIEILSFHVIPQFLISSDFSLSSKYPTLLGSEEDGVQEIRIGGELSFNGVAASNPNIMTGTGVVHKVGGAVLQAPTIADFLSPAVQGNVNDGVSFDLFGNVVDGAGYTGFDNIADTFSIYAPLFGPVYSDFGSDAAAVTYIENHTFDGNINLYTQDNGTKVTSVNGSEYFITEGAGGSIYINDLVRNAFGAASTTTIPGYNFTGSIPNGVFTPLPEENLLEVATANYSLFAAIVEKVGKASLLTSGNKTVLAVDNSVITAATGITTVAQIEGLSEEDDADFLDALAEIIDRHIFTSVNFARRMSTLPSDITNELDEEVLVGAIGGNLVIILDPSLPETENVGFVATNITANNGVIHEVDGLIIL